MATVRDPALPGGLLFAVRLEDGCMVGSLDRVPDGTAHETFMGILPSGRCL